MIKEEYFSVKKKQKIKIDFSTGNLHLFIRITAERLIIHVFKWITTLLPLWNEQG